LKGFGHMIRATRRCRFASLTGLQARVPGRARKSDETIPRTHRRDQPRQRCQSIWRANHPSEVDKRGLLVTLPQSKESFCIPSNVYVLGTMNTADRSVKLLDAHCAVGSHLLS